MRVIEHWNRILREAMGSLCLEVVQTQMDSGNQAIRSEFTVQTALIRGWAK